MITWTKRCQIWWLKEYPFFNGTIRYNEHKNVFVHNYINFKTLEEAQSHVIKAIVLIDPSQYKLTIHTKGWPNNIGEGKYIPLFLSGKKYLWVEGIHQAWRPITNYYSIRFPITKPLEEVEEWCLKIIKRHHVRFLNAM